MSALRSSPAGMAAVVSRSVSDHVPGALVRAAPLREGLRVVVHSEIIPGGGPSGNGQRRPFEESITAETQRT